MSTTSTIIATLNPYMAAALIPSLLSTGYTLKLTLGPYDSHPFLSSYPDAAALIPAVRLPYMGAPDAWEPELEGVDYVLHVEGESVFVLRGRRGRGKVPAVLKALGSGMPGGSMDHHNPHFPPLVT